MLEMESQGNKKGLRDSQTIAPEQKEFCLVAVCVGETQGKKGNIGPLMFLGSYSTRHQAEKHRSGWADIYGDINIMVMGALEWVEINKDTTGSCCTQLVGSDEETPPAEPGTLDHYCEIWKKVIDSYTDVEESLSSWTTHQSIYSTHKDSLKEADSQHPEYEEIWLDHIKKTEGEEYFNRIIGKVSDISSALTMD